MMPEETPVDFDLWLQDLTDRLAQNKRVRRSLPGNGRLRFDRQLPFLCVYRRPPDRTDPGTFHLVTSEAAYLFADGSPQHHDQLVALGSAISETMREHYGVFLFIEIWADDDPTDDTIGALQPAFRLVTRAGDTLPTMIDSFTAALQAIEVSGTKATVVVERRSQIAPPGMKPLLASAEDDAANFLIGLAVRPIYCGREEALYPLVLQGLRRQLATALRKAIFAFMGIKKTSKGTNHESLGPSSFVKASRLIDQQLCEVAESFDFVLQVTPVNVQEVWQTFRNSSFKAMTPLRYRPLPYDPRLLKRKLYNIPLEEAEDVTLTYLFGEKQDELDRQLTALCDLGTPAFLNSSISLYGSVEPELAHLARTILAQPAVEECTPAETVKAHDIAAAARAEIDRYHQRLPAFLAAVEVRNDIAASMMVTQGRLFVSATAEICQDRLKPLLHHEVGTHLLTYINGRQQPFRQLYAGLAGYESLQEGLAVFAEYASGGLSLDRLRSLASRVLAVNGLLDGRPFVDSFAELYEQYRIPAKQAFVTTLRAYRGGGLTKDAIYLRGLRDLLEYLARGHDIEPLYVGKISLAHVPFVQELRRRTIVEPPAILPRFWEGAEAQRRLEKSRNLSVINLLEY